MNTKTRRKRCIYDTASWRKHYRFPSISEGLEEWRRRKEDDEVEEYAYDEYWDDYDEEYWEYEDREERLLREIEETPPLAEAPKPEIDIVAIDNLVRDVSERWKIEVK